MKDDSAPPSGGVGSSRWKELIEVASPISGRELDPTLPPLVPRPTLPSNHTLPSGGGPCWTPPAAPGRRLGLLPPGRSTENFYTGRLSEGLSEVDRTCRE